MADEVMDKTAAKDRVKRKKAVRDRWWAVAFIAPSFLLVAVFVYGFIGWTGYVSLSNLSLIHI